MADRVYNILPVDDPYRVDHAGMMFPEVKAAMRALQEVEELPVPPDLRRWTPDSDMLDWLGGFFGFQEDNVRNQREHLVLLLANGMMHLFPTPSMPLDTLETSVVKMIRKKVTGNYVKWCKFIGCKNNLIKLVERRGGSIEQDPQWRELMYTCLFLLIWGEAANLRFMPECLCFIYHNMLEELNKALDRFTGNVELQGVIPSYAGPNGFLNNIIVPIYEVVKAEADSNDGGAAPHSSWRNYDDMNEYFWSSRCFEQLRWPFSLNPKMNEDIPYDDIDNSESCSYLVKPIRERGYLVGLLPVPCLSSAYSGVKFFLKLI